MVPNQPTDGDGVRTDSAALGSGDERRTHASDALALVGGHLHRRRLLQAFSAVGTSSLAGCSVVRDLVESRGQPTEYGFGGTPTDGPDDSTPARTATGTATRTPTGTATEDPSATATATPTRAGNGTPSPEDDYGEQGYGQYGYGGPR